MKNNYNDLIGILEISPAGIILNKNEYANNFFRKNELPPYILNEILNNTQYNTFKIDIDSNSLWMNYKALENNNILIAFLDFTERALYEKDLIETTDELANALEEAEVFKEKYEEQSDKLVNTLDKLLEANETIIKYSEKIDRELRMASKLQKNLLPKEFIYNDFFKFNFKYQPSSHIGGDFFDIYPINDDEFFFIIADVSGHGVSASLVTAMFKMMFMYHANKTTSVAEMFFYLNNNLCGNIDNNFITAFLMKVNLKKAEIIYSNAAHPDGLILHNDNTVEHLKSNGTMLGLFENFEYSEHSASLDKGECIFLYTDGIPEAANPQNSKELFSIKRIEDIILNNPCDCRLLDMIVESAREFIGNNASFDDDITLIGLHREKFLI